MGRDTCKMEKETLWSQRAATVRRGAFGGALVGLVSALPAIASDPKDGLCEPEEDCAPIVVNDPKEYDDLTEQVYAKSAVTEWPNWPDVNVAAPQAIEGVSSIFAPGWGRSPKDIQIGTLVANKNGETWTEDWFLYDPDYNMDGMQQIWEFERTDHSTAAEVMQDYDLLNNPVYGHMGVKFQYKAPPLESDLATLPDALSYYVTDRYEYKVFADVAGVLTEAGALYRERWDVFGEIQWRDTWVLWQNFSLTIDPDPTGPSRTLHLVPAPSLSWSRKAFLYGQRSMPQKWHVSTTGIFKPIY